MKNKQKHVIIIGGGIIGSAIARELLLQNKQACKKQTNKEKKKNAKNQLQITILEKESTIGKHASGRNSTVIHSGINHKPGTLKAQMCIKGSKLLREYCKTNSIPMNECGTLVIARNKEEKKTLNILLNMGKKVGVPNLKIINQKELLKKEPYATGISALFSPTGAVVDTVAVLNYIAKEVKALGGKYITNEKVMDITSTNKGHIILTKNSDKGNKTRAKKQKYNADFIINCAGLYADRIAHMTNIAQEYHIIPFRGEYMQIKNLPINSMVYQAPNLKYPFLSVHFTRMVNGDVVAGPTAMLSFGRESYSKEINLHETLHMITKKNFIRMCLSKDFIKLVLHNGKISLSKKIFQKEIQTLTTKPISTKDITPYRAGIRPQVVGPDGKMVNDLLIKQTKNTLHVLNAVSPGFTCSLAFAKYVVKKISL